MMLNLLNLLIIALLWVFVLDLSGFITELETTLQKKLKRKVLIKKPFSCSLCMTFWTGLIYLLATQAFTIPMIGYVALLAFLTPVFNDMLLSIRELLIKIVNKVG